MCVVLVDMACVYVDLYDVDVAMCVVCSIVDACRNVLLGMWCMCIDCYDVTGCVRTWMRRWLLVGRQSVRASQWWLTAGRIASGVCAGRGAGCGMHGWGVQCVRGHEWLWL